MFSKFSQTEKENLFLGEDRATEPTWTSCSSFGMEIQSNELKSPPQQLPNYFFNPNWDNSLGQSDPFEPYIGGKNSSNTSTYSTPLNSPPKLNLLSIMDHQIRAPFSADPGRFTCFDGGSLNGQNGKFGLRESEFLRRLTPRMESNKSIEVVGSALCVEENKDGFLQDGDSGSDKKFSTRSSTPENGEIGDSREESSVSEQIPGREIGMKFQSNANAKKRKSIGRGKLVPKVAAETELESNSNRSKSDEATGNEDRKQTKDSEKPSEPPKDYIHVRARRGQATDSHSLAERVRREKIGERMKLLQDLVPGCNKVTGKAVMLDEIINYVQSLQRQVEFLSMKLATVNPRMEFNMETLLSKNAFQSRGSMPESIYPLGSTTSSAFPYGYLSPQDPSLQIGISDGEKTPFFAPCIEGFGEGASQGLTLWEDDLQSVAHMGFGQRNFSC